jgi:glycosyltransferase involved in cell wall biosynthesis
MSKLDVVINGKRYVPEAPGSNISYQKVGIGVTTHNRNALVASTVSKIQEFTPNSKIVVVDDASDSPVKINDVEVFRFQTNVGIARAKNKCLELLEGCQHIFLFDDDTYPIKDEWYLPYINSPEHHLMYLFDKWANGRPVGDDSILYTDSNHSVHTHARGCMLYVDEIALAVVGGMDVGFGKAMEEHGDWSTRIYNAGLTTFKHMDVLNSHQLIHSMDQHQEVASSISRADRIEFLERNANLAIERRESSDFAPYGKDVVIACFFANVNDPQRNTEWKPDLKAVYNLSKSLKLHDVEFILIHNCFDLPNKVEISTSPYFERWLKEWQYLRDRRDISNVFLVDSTDVDMVNNPFPHIDNQKLYVGDEPGQTLNNRWLLNMHTEPSVHSYLQENASLQLLNCGVVGGSRELVMDLCREMYTYHVDYPQDQTEMGIFNKLLHSKYSDIIEYGRHVTSNFKKFERQTDAWFRHK